MDALSNRQAKVILRRYVEEPRNARQTPVRLNKA